MAKSINSQRAKHVKAYGRQSKNVEDFRDTEIGPKKFKGKTRRVQAENTRRGLDEKVLNKSAMTEDKSVADVTSTRETDYLNWRMNRQREIRGPAVGQLTKNRDLNSSPSSFEFFKHTVKNKKGKK